MAQPQVRLGTGRTVHLGAILPARQIEGERFTLLELPDGRRRLVPSLEYYLGSGKGEYAAPAKTSWREKALASIKQTLGNTQQGDCVIASKIHSLGVWTGNAKGAPLLSSDDEALSIYHSLCGRGDNGCVISDVLDAMKAGRFSVGGQIHKIDGYVAVNTANQALVQAAVALFGAALPLGINLPGSWANAVNGDDFLWDDTNDSSVGGHDVPILDYDERGVQIATWGHWGTITWSALANRQIVSEAYLMLGPDWIGQANLSPSGLNVDQLRADLAAIGGGTIPPDPGPGPAPGPGPGPAPGPSLLRCLALGLEEFWTCWATGRYSGLAAARVQGGPGKEGDMSVRAKVSPLQCAGAAAWTAILCAMGQLPAAGPGRGGCGCHGQQ